MKRLRLTVLSILVLLAVVAVGVFWRISDSRLQSETDALDAGDLNLQSETQTPEPLPGDFGGSFALTDQNGMRRTDMDFRGKYMLVFFGYTSCPDVCPTTLAVEAEALDMARRIAAGPTFAHGITKTQLNQEWSMGLDQAIEAEAQAQAICMQTRDFERAYRAFVAKQAPAFEGT